MSLIAGGILMLGMGAFGVASAVEQRKDAKDAQKDADRIAAAENENAKYAQTLEKRRTENSKDYEPGYALLADEVQKKPNLMEEAIPLTTGLIAADDIMQKNIAPNSAAGGTAPGTARRGAVELGGMAGTIAAVSDNTQQLKTSLDMEHFNQRKQAIDLGKAYVGS